MCYDCSEKLRCLSWSCRSERTLYSVGAVQRVPARQSSPVCMTSLQRRPAGPLQWFREANAEDQMPLHFISPYLNRSHDSHMCSSTSDILPAPRNAQQKHEWIDSHPKRHWRLWGSKHNPNAECMNQCEPRYDPQLVKYIRNKYGLPMGNKLPNNSPNCRGFKQSAFFNHQILDSSRSSRLRPSRRDVWPSLKVRAVQISTQG